MGAGTLECDVTFTKDLELVCRHAQNDLATTTDILLTPLASTCIEPFTPARLDANGAVRRAGPRRMPHERADARRVQDAARQDRRVRSGGANRRGSSSRRAAPRVPISASGVERGTLLTHAESIALFKRLGVRMTPELKERQRRAAVQRRHARAARATAHRRVSRRRRSAERRVPAIVRSARRRVLDRARARVRQASAVARQRCCSRRARGVCAATRRPASTSGRRRCSALLDLDAEGRIVPSRAARAARAAGLDIITWTLERSGNLAAPNNGFYYRTIDAAITREGDVMRGRRRARARRRRARHLLRLAGDRQLLRGLRRFALKAACAGSGRARPIPSRIAGSGVRMRGELFIVATFVVAGCASAQQRWLGPDERLDRDGRGHGVRAAASRERPDDDRARARRHGLVHARATAIASAA